jgi:tetratricopeptide (TPR) repeat protein
LRGKFVQKAALSGLLIQITFEARMGNEEATIVQLVHVDETGDSYYRMRWPGQVLAEQNPSWRIINIDANSSERFTLALEADLLVIYQSHDVDLFPVLKRRKEMGKKTLVEYNDNFYEPPPESPAAGHWRSPLIWQVYEFFMQECDGVIVTCEALKDLLSTKVDTEFHVLKNHLPAPFPDFDDVFSEPGEQINIGWAGSVGHMSDFLSIAPVLKDLLKHPEVMLYFMGNESIPSLLPLPEDRIKFTNWGSMEEYYTFLRDLHIGLAPIRETPYNHCRSDVKALELSSRGIVPVLTDAQPYKEFLKQTKLKGFTSFKELKDTVSAYVKDPKKIKKDAKRCHKYIEKNRQAANNTERSELYSQMLSGERSAFHWPYPLGYHEIQGSPQNVSRHQRMLTEIKQLFKAGQIQKGEQNLQVLLSEYKFSALPALTHLNFLEQTHSDQLNSQLEEYLKRFPNDVRFQLFRLKIAAEPEEKLSIWKDIVSLLENSVPVYAEYFQNKIIPAACSYLAQDEQMLALGRKLLKIYPQSAQLQYELGVVLERKGDDKKALKHFQTVLKLLENHTQNQEYLATASRSYFESWCSALDTRLKKTF